MKKPKIKRDNSVFSRGSFTSRVVSVYERELPKRGEEKENYWRLLFTYQIKITDIRHDVKIKSPNVEYEILKSEL